MVVAIETGPYPRHSSSCGSFVKYIITERLAKNSNILYDLNLRFRNPPSEAPALGDTLHETSGVVSTRIKSPYIRRDSSQSSRLTTPTVCQRKEE